ncbi:hypothetical protein [Morganella morganii]|uniref:hypothetical protein n=1 Tax=Morganella morganii TaxID=582 RepID=UPI003D7FF96C
MNKLSPDEEQQILTVCHQPEYASLPQPQIVPKLADKGIYLAGRQQRPKRVLAPTTFTVLPC